MPRTRGTEAALCAVECEPCYWYSLGDSQNHSVPSHSPKILQLFLRPMCCILTQVRRKYAASCVYLMKVFEHKISF